MPKSRYYKILGLSNNAPLKEVKKRYRTLVMKYHPDRNTTPEAQELFIRITDAYQKILDENFIPKASTKSSSQHAKEDKIKEREERLKKARERFRQQNIKEDKENIQYFKQLTTGKKWAYLKIVALVSILFSSLLLIDLFLPYRITEKEIISNLLNIELNSDNQLVGAIKTTDNSIYFVEDIDSELFAETKYVTIVSSWIFNSPIYIISQNNTKLKYYKLNNTLHSFTFYIILFLMIPVFTIWYKRMNSAFTFLYFLSYYGISGFIIILTLILFL